MSAMKEKYVIEQLALGESKIYILIKHIYPHIYKPIISNLALNFSSSCITESGLTFIGIKLNKLKLFKINIILFYIIKKNLLIIYANI